MTNQVPETTDCLEQLKSTLQHFVDERDWAQFHSPKNLAMAMIVEAAELVEHFQWLSEEESRNISGKKLEEVSHEIADTFVYLLRLTQVLDIDIIKAAEAKIQLNAKKYPAELARGSNAKYTEYKQK